MKLVGKRIVGVTRFEIYFETNTEYALNRCTGFVDILKPGGLNYDIVSLMCLAVFCSEGTPVVDTVGLGFKEFLRVWGNFDWRGEGFYFPRGNDGVQSIIDELRKKSVRRKIKKEERGEGGVRFFDPVSGENLGEGVKGECLEFIEGGLREGYRMFCEVEVRRESGARKGVKRDENASLLSFYVVTLDTTLPQLTRLATPTPPPS